VPNFSLREWKRSETKGDGRILLGDDTGGGPFMLRSIKFQCVGVGISTGQSCVYTRV